MNEIIELNDLEKGIDNTRRTIEIDPGELERRVSILKDYLKLVMDNNKEHFKKSSNAQKVYLDGDLYQVYLKAMDMGLTQLERLNLSGDLIWKEFCKSPRNPRYFENDDNYKDHRG